MTDTSTFTPDEQAQFDAMREDPAPAKPVEQEKAAQEDPAVVDDDGEDEQESPQRQQMVPQKALHAEREKRKAEAAKRAKIEQEYAEARQRLAYYEGLQQGRQPQAEPRQEPKIPDPDEDPIAAIKFQQDYIRQQVQQQQQEQQRQAIARQQQEFIADVSQEWEQFKKAAPEAEDAYNHVLTARDNELKLMGYNTDQRRAIINGEEFQAMQAARREGRPIGEYLMEIAQYRGWQKPQPQVQVKDGRDSVKSLSGVGSAPTGPMTIERLAAMSEREFSAYSAKNPETVRRIMGG